MKITRTQVEREKDNTMEEVAGNRKKREDIKKKTHKNCSLITQVYIDDIPALHPTSSSLPPPPSFLVLPIFSLFFLLLLLLHLKRTTN